MSGNNCGCPGNINSQAQGQIGPPGYCPPCVGVLEAQIEEQIGALQGEVTAIGEALDLAEAAIAEAEAAIIILQGEMDNAEAAILVIQNQLIPIEGNIITLTNNLNALILEVQGIDGRVIILESLVGWLEVRTIRSNYTVTSVAGIPDGGTADNLAAVTPAALGFAAATALETYLTTRKITINASGYYAEGDAGGGVFYVVKNAGLTANNATVFTLTGIGADWRAVRTANQGRITLSEAGCLPGSQSSTIRKRNHLQYCRALDTGLRVEVDASYELEWDAAFTTSTAMINCVGISDDAELRLLSGGIMITHGVDNSQAYFSGFKLWASDSDGSVIVGFLSLADAVHMRSLVYEDIEHFGRIRIVLNGFSVETDQAGKGIDYFGYLNCRARNVFVTCIRLENVPYKKAEIRGNEITNFDYLFINSGVTNSGTYSTAIAQAKRELLIEANTVICDDDFFAAADSGSYYAFVVAEGRSVVYRGNHVEGMKTDSVTALYDAYLSCGQVLYVGNTWKNNMCFNSSKVNAVLMKSKGGSVLDEDGAGTALRIYRDSSFLIERAWLDRISRADTNAWVQMGDISNNTICELWQCENISIDVIGLCFFTSSEGFKNFTFKNVSIVCDRTQWSSPATTFIVRPADLQLTTMDYADAFSSVSGLTLQVRFPDPAIGTLGLLRGVLNTPSDAVAEYEQVDIQDVHITAGFTTDVITLFQSKKFNIRNCSFADNSAITGAIRLLRSCTYDELNINNVHLSQAGNRVWVAGGLRTFGRRTRANYTVRTQGLGASADFLTTSNTADRFILDRSVPLADWWITNVSMSLTGPALRYGELSPWYAKGNVTAATGTVFAVNTTDDDITVTDNPFVVGDILRASSTGDLPGPLVAGIYYIVCDVDGDDIQLTDEFGGSPLDLTTAGTGTITLHREERQFLIYTNASNVKRVAPMVKYGEDDGDFTRFSNDQPKWAVGAAADLQFRLANSAGDTSGLGFRVARLPLGVFDVNVRVWSDIIANPWS